MDERIPQYFSHELSENERIALLKEAKTDENIKKGLVTYQNVQSFLFFSPEYTDMEAGSKGYSQLMKRQKRKLLKRYTHLAVVYTAVACLLIAGTWMLAISYSRSSTMERMVASGAQELYVPTGQYARITLPDGSTAWLNAGSTLRYPSVFGKERRVFLSGEAFFQVARQRKAPFIVSTEMVDIKALGTQFNVRSYPQKPCLKVSLLEGSVKVYQPFAEEEGTILNPKQQLLLENGEFRLEDGIDEDQLLWREGIFSFKKEHLDIIIEKLEWHYGIHIIVQNPNILKYEYTGKFRQRDGIIEILRIIQKIHKFQMRKEENSNRIILY
ncbi:MAG: FecR domain-containing protein [Tannerellaceae bacterium]|jgi:ferric-dicitrate binding protein FerR (iron transport regulator)|nr:FecR domain-containing protein [Tannerellaceae bacterium]